MRAAPEATFAASASPRFALSHVDSKAQLDVAAALRKRIFRERRQISFDEALEARRDREGHVFLLFEHALPVAVGRVLPYPSRRSATLGLSRSVGAQGADSEIGRVACEADARAPYRALLLLTLGARWLLEHTQLRRYVGYCHPRLVDSYRKLGATPGERIVVPNRSDPYFVITGSYEVAEDLGSRLLGLP